MKTVATLGSLLIFAMLGISGCATVPGASGQEQAIIKINNTFLA